jgi:chitodextrinase
MIQQSEKHYGKTETNRSKICALAAISYLARHDGARLLLAALALVLGLANFAQAQTQLAALPLDSNGWTVFTPTVGTGSCGNSSSNYTGTCVVFVAANGNDSTCAAQLPSVTSPSAGQACATINKGNGLLRPGASADWLLLNRGDTFVGQDFKGSGTGNTPPGLCSQSGISATQPLLISSYGTGARPIVEPNPGDGSAIGSMAGGGCGGGGNNIAIVSIEFYAYTRDPRNPSYNPLSPDIQGTYFLNPITWMLIEDCKFSFFTTDIDVNSMSLTSPMSNVSIRRNVVVDAYGTAAHSQGIYVDGVTNLLIQENIVDNNGWNATVSGAGPTIFNHNAYLTAANGPVTVLGNIFSNDASGNQFRSGGTITDNAFIRNPYGHNIGQPYSGLQTLVNNNVHIEQINNTANNGSVLSIDTINTFSSYAGQAFNLGTATYSGNVMVHGAPGAGGIYIDSGQVGSVASNNIACNLTQDGGAPSGVLIWDQSGTGSLTGNYQDVTDCDHYNYPSPDLTVGTYDTSLSTGSCGGNTVGTTANFICKARQQSKANWSIPLMADAFNTYIRAGFSITPPPNTNPTADTIPPSVPTALVGTVASAKQINLSWTASTDNVGVTGYKVFRNGAQLGTTASTSYSDTGLSAATTYTYTVAAYDAAGNTSAQSSGVSVTTLSTLAPALPLSISISSPANGATIHGNGSVNIASNASDSTSIESITIKGDSNVLFTCASATSCSATWQGKSITKGTHVISATAVDAFGSTSSVSVTILALK